MPTNDVKLDEIRKLLLSLLLARPGATPITVLDRDYFEAEGQYVPCHQFGYADIVDFLKSMPEYFSVEFYNNRHHVRGIASEKTKHVSSLVSRQKNTAKAKSVAPQYRQYNRPCSFRFIPAPRRQRVKIPAEQLSQLVMYVKSNPKGVSLQNAKEMLENQLPHIGISVSDLRDQLRELHHSLYLDRDTIYSQPVNDVAQEAKNYLQPPTVKKPQPSAMEYVGGDEGSDIEENFLSDDDFALDYVSSNHPKQSKKRERLAASFTRNNEQNAMFNHNDDINVDEYFAASSRRDNQDFRIRSPTFNDLSILINDRTKSRLDKLIRKHPEGIWCAELPEKFLKEYNVQLNYQDIGFTSVREYVSLLPNIFYMTRKNSDDFLLYSADKRPTDPDQESPRSESVEIKSSSCEKYDEHNAMRIHDNNDCAPIPADVSSTITKTFVPDDVMNYNDSVDQLLVTQLERAKKHLEVYVVELFNPSFFWVHLREYKPRFEKLMDNINVFYNINKDKYIIPKIALKKGLNCACIYLQRWHRAIIKSVKPDFKVTVFFYDYGTLKTYAPEDVYFLHKQFSFLPAQAIPCGLYNVKPCVGDRWKKSVTEKLSDKICDSVLALTIISVDSLNNSMMVYLSDTSEEEDEHINEWLIKEKLAQHGKMVCSQINEWLIKEKLAQHGKMVYSVSMLYNFPHFHYLKCNNKIVQPVVSMADANVNSIVKFDVKNEWKSVEFLHKLLSEEAPQQELQTVHSSVDAASSDSKSQSTDYSKNQKPSNPRMKLLEKLRTLKIASNSNSNIATPRQNHNCKDNVQQVDLNKKIDSENDNANKHCAFNLDFSLRDSENEEMSEKDFGTFKSLYGGRGLMEPFDWSVLKKNDNSCEATGTSSNMDNMIKEYKNNVSKDESESHEFNNNQDKQSLPVNPYFLNITRKEKEYYLPERNIDYEFRNGSRSVAKLRNKMQINNDKYTPVVVTKNILETLCHNIQSQAALNPDTNPVRTNGVAFSKEISVTSKNINENDEACNTKTKEKIENGAFDANMKSSFSHMNNNEDSTNKATKINDKKTFGSSTDSFESNTNDKVFNFKHKKLLDSLRRMKKTTMDSSTSSTSSTLESPNTRNSPNIKQIKLPFSSHSSKTRTSPSIEQNNSSFSSHSSSSNITSSTISDDEDSRSQSSVCFTKLHNFSKLTPTSSSNLSSDCNSKETKGLLFSDNDSVASLNLDNFKQDQSLKINSITSKVDNSKQSDSTVKKSHSTKGARLLKNATSTSDIELPSDKLSNQKHVSNDKSCNKKEGELINELMVDCGKCKSTNNDVLEEVLPIFNNCDVTDAPEEVLPVFNDCDVESDDSNWDVGNLQQFLRLMNPNRQCKLE